MNILSVTAASFFAIAQFKKFEALEVTSVQMWIDLYAGMCPFEQFGDRAEICIMLLTAHFLELDWEEKGITASNAKAVNMGESLSNRRQPSPPQTNMVSDAYLSRTTYGQQFAVIRDFIKSGGSFFGDTNIVVPPFLAW
jgi:hypothetical protein